jgi:predicted short-subunit dehydrogenase-like oxidoreductase (DUF2520 family)
MPLKTLNILGAGRVGCTLARLWQAQSCMRVQAVCNTTLASAQNACAFIGEGNAYAALDSMPRADVWMIAVPDAHIAATAQQLADLHGDASAAFHCSGAQSAASLLPLQQAGWTTASAHCLLSFATREIAVAQFKDTPCALEGDPDLLAQLRPLFSAIGAQCFEVASADKVLYHAAAVFATNFLPVLQGLAEDAWRATGMPAHLIAELRQRLLSNSVSNITALGPAGALTGPAARGDIEAIARQAAVVSNWDAQAGAAYRALSDLALRMAKTSKEAAATAATTR